MAVQPGRRPERGSDTEPHHDEHHPGPASDDGAAATHHTAGHADHGTDPTPTAGGGQTGGNITMPNVVGMGGGQAEQVLKDAGFTKVVITSGDGGNEAALRERKVKTQNPPAGSSVAAGTEIVLTVFNADENGGGKG